jgi:tetraacyldisaccharide 4'-kinase
LSFQDYLYELATDKATGLAATAVKAGLFILSLVYGSAVSVWIFVCKFIKIRLPCRVISVGNITLGGTGKTVMVELIVDHLKNLGHKTAVLSRGYKRPRVTSAKSLPGYETMGDEPFMMLEKFQDVPVLVGPDRVRSAKTALADHKVDTVVLDDGFQQWRIKKDLEIVMLDGAAPFGNSRVLPRGLLRQPIYTLKAADVIVLTGPGNADSSFTKKLLSRINPRALVVRAQHSAKAVFCLSRKSQLLGVDFLKGQTAAVFCGLGNPDSFRSLLAETGLQEGMFFRFPDHHRYYEDDLERIFRQASLKGIRLLVTTEKDAVRIPLAASKRFGENIFVLKVKLKIKNEEQRFFDRLQRVYSS